MRSSPVTDERAQARAPERDAPEPEPELERMRDRWLRARADLENYRKRSDQEVERRFGDARDRLLLDWLEVVDDVDRGLQFGSVADASLRQLRQLMLAVLARHGVERVEAEGARFDPELHEAVGVKDTGEAPPNTVVEVARAGYRVGDRVLRPARVIVSRKPSAEATG
jgi:molecular chaperone GrpE